MISIIDLGIIYYQIQDQNVNVNSRVLLRDKSSIYVKLSIDLFIIISEPI